MRFCCGRADDLRWFARELAHLPWPFQILRPRALVKALASHARALLELVPQRR